MFLSVFFSLIVGMTSWALSSHNGRESVLDVGDDFARTVMLLDTYIFESQLATMKSVTDFAASFVGRFEVKLDVTGNSTVTIDVDVATLTQGLLGLIVEFEEILSAGASFTNGAVYVLYRDVFNPRHPALSTFTLLTRDSWGRPMMRTKVNAKGQPLVVPVAVPELANSTIYPREDVFYDASERSSKLHWTGLFEMDLADPEMAGTQFFGYHHDISLDALTLVPSANLTADNLADVNFQGGVVLASTFSHLRSLQTDRGLAPTHLNSAISLISQLGPDGRLVYPPIFATGPVSVEDNEVLNTLLSTVTPMRTAGTRTGDDRVSFGARAALAGRAGGARLGLLVRIALAWLSCRFLFRALLFAYRFACAFVVVDGITCHCSICKVRSCRLPGNPQRRLRRALGGASLL